MCRPRALPSTRIRCCGFRVEVKQVELSGPEISFMRGDGGSMYLGNADTPAPDRPAADPALSPAEIDAADGGFPDLLAALYIMDRGIEPQLEGAINAGFERFAVVNGTITVCDARAGAPLPRHRPQRRPRQDDFGACRDARHLRLRRPLDRDHRSRPRRQFRQPRHVGGLLAAHHRRHFPGPRR